MAAVGMLAGIGASPASANSPAPKLCQAFGVSPDAQSSESAMCVTADITRDPLTQEETSRTLHVYVSHDGGHSWALARGVGLPPIPSLDAPPPSSGTGYVEVFGTVPTQVVYSAGYATNHTVYLATAGQAGGLYQSTDEGDSWTLANTSSDLGPNFLAYVDPRSTQPDLGLHRYPLALSNRVDPERIDGPVTTQEKGADPAYSRLFAFAPKAYRGMQLLDAAEVWHADADPPFSTDVASLRSCTFDLDCSTVLHTFQRGSGLLSLVLAGDFDRTGLVLVYDWSADNNRPAPGWLESTDGGRSFEPWPFTTRAARDVDARHGKNADITVATNPHRPGMLVASVVYNMRDVARQRIYLSYDDGRRWALRSDKVMPTGFQWVDSHQLILGADGHLFELSAQALPSHSEPQQDPFNPKQGLWCSADAGRTWAPTCPK